uniref:Uncharacterized protein n=1 Tax=Siphoviridae sp. ctgn638 TaxID=2827913 RepID=A0A8S5TLM0_9CAUD|nr:MAG TPA: hypothetical protein [Siphoviridae sp. ctgn638]
MKWELIIAGSALFITIIVNIGTIAFFAGILKSNQENQKEALLNLKNDFKEHFDRLEKKQDKHNGLIERTYKNERDISVLQEQVKVENHRIEDLERLS